ncbi:hypothetical protein, variant 1 [Aphanomyces astaci]|uniref:Uncharacterized protein n=1 Tax=Aphanomyces astaci TaxID=112090 RepID=W4GYM9_APHAT|nr:hypothetical protein, variant 1 [Aphanomyces astaci]ETV84099.1 hypothetical protein, variant 1 [Aphanomyces astaci]|eukprot:XP_009825791.1 hypothetical protein, variant 1 [Aphanomyces astaci]
MSKADKGKVEKKGRFTIIDLPSDEPSPLSSFRTGVLPMSPLRGTSSGGNRSFRHIDDDEEDIVAPELPRKTRVKQKGRFTIIDLDPNTPSPERGLRRGFRDDVTISEATSDVTQPPPSSVEPQRTANRPVATDVEEDAPNTTNPTNPPANASTSAPTKAPDFNSTHNPACCMFRSPLMHPQAPPCPPPCMVHFDPSSLCSLPSPASFVAVPVHQYRDHQDMLAALLQQNKDMRMLIQTLQAQQGRILQIAKGMSVEPTTPDDPHR